MKFDDKEFNISLFSNEKQLQMNILKLAKDSPELSQLIKINNITDKEIIDNSDFFLQMLIELEKKDKGYEFIIKRNKTQKLVLKQVFSKNEIWFNFIRQNSLMFTAISEPDENATISKIYLSNKNRKDLYKMFQIFANSYIKQNQILEGFYIQGKENTGKSYILQAFCNYFASNGIKCAYIDILKYIQYIYKKSFDWKEEFLNEFKNIPVLFIDNFGLEYFYESHIKELVEILEYRYKNNLPIFISSPFSLLELKRNCLAYNDNDKNISTSYNINKLISLIEKITNIFTISN